MVRRERDPLGTVAAVRAAEELSCGLHLRGEARADRDVALAVVAVPLVLERVAGPCREGDLAAERRIRSSEAADRLLVVERAELRDRRLADVRAPPLDDRAVLFVMEDAARVHRPGVEAPDRPEVVMLAVRRRIRVPGHRRLRQAR